MAFISAPRADCAACPVHALAELCVRLQTGNRAHRPFCADLRRVLFHFIQGLPACPQFSVHFRLGHSCGKNGLLAAVVYFRPSQHIPVAVCGKHRFKIPAEISSAGMGVFSAAPAPASDALARARAAASARQNGHRAAFQLGKGLDLPVQDGNYYFRLYACGRVLYPFAQKDMQGAAREDTQ